MIWKLAKCVQLKQTAGTTGFAKDDLVPNLFHSPAMRPLKNSEVESVAGGPESEVGNGIIPGP